MNIDHALEYREKEIKTELQNDDGVDPAKLAPLSLGEVDSLSDQLYDVKTHTGIADACRSTWVNAFPHPSYFKTVTLSDGYIASLNSNQTAQE